MNKAISHLVLSFGIGLMALLTACAPAAPPTPDTPSPTIRVAPPTLAATPTQTTAATATLSRTATPVPETSINLPTSSETIFTIRNEAPFSGRAGDAKPDWLGWGAQAFSIAPDGDFWLLDSAAQPQRLLRFSPPYDQPQIVSLEGLATGAAGVEAARDAVWVLDVASQPPRLVKLALDGKAQASYDLPRGLWPENGLTGIALVQDEEPLIELEFGASLYRLFGPDGRVAPQKLEGYTFGNRLFRVEAGSRGSSGIVYAGEVKVDVAVEHTLGGLRLLGAASDGSFFVEVDDLFTNPSVVVEREVRCYTTAGKLLGTAYPLTSVDPGQDLVAGADGLVYQLVSNPDHSVQIVRLGFLPGGHQPFPTPTPTQSPTPLTPLLPTWTVTPADATGLDLARHTLISFFTLLHDGRYGEAAPLYGGPYDGFRENNPDIPKEDYAALWQAVCTRQTLCLSVAGIVEEKQVAPDEFEFVIEFIWRDGTLFKFGPCCGATEAEIPPVWQFPYTVKKIDGQYRVMEGPVYLP